MVNSAPFAPVGSRPTRVVSPVVMTPVKPFYVTDNNGTTPRLTGYHDHHRQINHRLIVSAPRCQADLSVRPTDMRMDVLCNP
jgi:hypothetical protein